MTINNNFDSLAQQLANGYSRLRKTQPSDPRKREKWALALSQYCEKVFLLSEAREAGKAIPSDVLERITQRVEKIAKNTPRRWIFQSNEQKLIEKARWTVTEMKKPFIGKRPKERCAPIRPLKKVSSIGGLLSLCLFTGGMPGAAADCSEPEYDAPQSLCDQGGCTLPNIDPQPEVVDSRTFDTIRPGSWCFSSHIDEMRHYLIQKGQKGLNVQVPTFAENVTHAGLAIGSSRDHLEILEINQLFNSLMRNKYTYDQLLPGEAIICSDPEMFLDDAKGLNGKVLQLVEKRTSTLSTYNNPYNVDGLAKIPLLSRTFKGEDRRNLIDTLIVHLFDITSSRRFFCTQFATEMTQVARLMQRFPHLESQVVEACKGVNLENEEARRAVISKIDKMMKREGIWRRAIKDPLFEISSQTVLPYDMVNLGVKGNARFTRIEKPHSAESPLQGVALLEKELVTLLLLYEKGALVGENRARAEKIIQWMRKEGGYSDSTMNCLVSRCRLSSDLSPCIKSCIDETISWVDKIIIYLHAIEINRAIATLFEDKGFINFVTRTVKGVERLGAKEIIESSVRALFPTDHPSLFTRIRNFIVTKVALPLRLETVTKYVPLAVAYGPVNSLVSEFMEKYQIHDRIQLAKATFQYLYSQLHF